MKTNWEELIDKCFQSVMKDIGKKYKVSDTLSDILIDSLSEHLPSAIDEAVKEAEERMTLKNAGLYRQLFGEMKDKTFTTKELWAAVKKMEKEHNEKQKDIHNCPPCPLPHYPHPYQPYQNPPLHYHNGNPCYQSPCVWC